MHYSKNFQVSLYCFFLLFLSTNLFAQLSGTYRVGSGGNYLTLFNAVADVNNVGLNGDAVFELIDGYRQEELIRIYDYPGNDQYTLTIRPEAGADTCVIYRDWDYTVGLLDCRNVILDGRPGGVGKEQKLIIRQINEYAVTPAVQFGDYGTSSEFDNDTSRVNTVRYCRLESNGRSIANFELSESCIMEHCDIVSKNGRATSVVDGILVASSSNAIIRNNYIHDLSSTNPSTLMSGIEISTIDGPVQIYGNFISLGYTNQDSSSFYGIRHRNYSSFLTEIYFNTIHIGGNQDASMSYPWPACGIWSDQTGPMTVKNNIFSLKRSGISNYGIYIREDPGIYDFNYNNYDVDTDAQGQIGYYLSQSASTLLNWQGISGGQDANSTTTKTFFIDETATDLHLSGPSFVDTELHGTHIAGFEPTDIDGQTRVIPFKGADEPSAEIMLIAPNGGEVWEQGKTYSIVIHEEFGNTVSIAYENQDMGVPSTEITANAAVGSYDWTIPESIESGDGYKIIITNTEGYADESDKVFSIRDISAPDAPTNLTAGGSSPSPWQSSPTFSLNWTNPNDFSGIINAKYKIGAVPANNEDFTGTLSGTPIQSITFSTEGTSILYLWLVDGAGNEDYTHYATVDLRYDVSVGVPGNFSETNGIVDNTWQNYLASPEFSWTAPDDISGIDQYNVYLGPSETGTTITDNTTTNSYTANDVGEGITFFRLQAVDNAGNTGNWVTGFTYRYDNTPPTNPTSSWEQGSVTSDTWQNGVSDPAFYWSGAADGLSGVPRYLVYFGSNSTGVPETEVTTNYYNAPAAANGVSYLNIITEDGAGNQSVQETIFIFKHDGTTPENPTACADISTLGSVSAVWQNTNNDPNFTWSGASDSPSGIEDYNYYWGSDENGVSIDAVADAALDPAAVDTGSYYLRYRTNDLAGNSSSWITGYTFQFDNIAPIVEASVADTSATVSFSVSWVNGSDKGGSGLTEYYSVKVKDGEAGIWDSWKTNFQGTNDIYNGADGHTYYFEATGRDNAGNVEEFSSTAECSVLVDLLASDDDPPAAPTNLLAQGSAPSPWINSVSFELTWQNPSDMSGIAKAYYKLGSAPTANSDTIGSLAGQPPVNVDATQESGQDIYIWLEDNRGNVNYLNNAMVELRYDLTKPSGAQANSPVTAGKNFNVSWSNGLDNGGSGLSGNFDLRYKVGDQSWQDWEIDYTGTEKLFTDAVHGEIYHFEVAARDNAGNVEDFSGTAESSTTIDTTTADTDPPASPIDLTAGGSAPSPWQNNPAFNLNWTNPADGSGIAKAWYKFNNPPASSVDTSGSANGTPPVAVTATVEGGQSLYLWLQDGLGNSDYNSRVRIVLQYDGSKPQSTVANSPANSTSSSFSVSWSGSSDLGGSGLSGNYDVKYRDGAGTWQAWLSDYSGSDATFQSGVTGHTYYFEAAARDNADNIEDFTETAECSTVVNISGDTTPPAAPLYLASTPSSWTNIDEFTLTWQNQEVNTNIAGAYYKVGSAPQTDEDGTYVLGAVTDLSNVSTGNAGEHMIWLWLKDAAGNTSYLNSASTSLRFDNVPPEIQDPTVENQGVGTNVIITSSGEDQHSGLKKLMLYYRQTGDFSMLDSVSMLGQTSGIIPASFNTQRGLEYTLVATDNAGMQSRIPVSGFNYVEIRITGDGVFNQDNSGQPLSQHTGEQVTDYRIVSVPLELDDKRPSKVFGDNLGDYDGKSWKLFAVSGNSLLDYPTIQEMNIVEPGEGFLLLVSSAGQVIRSGSGTTPASSSYTSIPLNIGWNLVGNPFDFDIPFSHLSVDGSLPEAHYLGSNGWTNVSISYLKKWEGLAVYSTSNTALDIDLSSSQLSSSSVLDGFDEDYWGIQISAIGTEGLDLDNFIGVYPAGSEKKRTQWHEPPMMANGVSLAFPTNQAMQKQQENMDERFSTYLKEYSEQGDYWDMDIQGRAYEKISLDFYELGTIPPDFNIYLVDLEQQLAYDLNKEGWQKDLVLNSSGNRSFRIIVGNAEAADIYSEGIQLLPETIELRQNYPNPFNPQTTIVFTLPAVNSVKLEIFNVLGQKIISLIDGENIASGYHAISWNGLNQTGERVSSGIYIIRLMAGDNVIFSKSVLTK